MHTEYSVREQETKRLSVWMPFYMSIMSLFKPGQNNSNKYSKRIKIPTLVPTRLTASYHMLIEDP